MNRFFSSIFIACLPVALSLSGSVQAQMVPEGGGMKQELADKGYNFRLYGKFRPKVTFSDGGNGDSSTDIRDDSSRLGIQGKIPINDRLHAVLRGEWRVEIGENNDQDGRSAGGSLGNARLAYAGLQSKDAGFLGIGQQWNPYYDLVGVPVDVLYNASNTPVGYGRSGAPFRNSNMIKYAHSVGAFKVSAGLQADGSNNADNVDGFTIGAGLDVGKGYIGVAYWRQNLDESVPLSTTTADTFDVRGTATTSVDSSMVTRRADGKYYDTDNNEVDRVPGVTTTSLFDEQRTFLGIAAGFNVTEDLYVSALYQDIEKDHDSGSPRVDSDPSALDIAAVYSFGDGMKLLAGAFTYDPDNAAGDEEKGFTLGLAKNLSPGLDIYVDWLREDRDAEDDARNQVNFGIRYSFDVGLL